MKGKENATTSGGVDGNAAVSGSVADEGENPKTRNRNQKPTPPQNFCFSSLSRKAAELNVSTRRSTKRSASES
jgi:hypothetical protein